jgi:hypothetical protein
MTTNYLLESDESDDEMLADLKASIKDLAARINELDDVVTILEKRAKQRESDWNTEEVQKHL